jgi:hypothetical protein
MGVGVLDGSYLVMANFGEPVTYDKTTTTFQFPYLEYNCMSEYPSLISGYPSIFVLDLCSSEKNNQKFIYDPITRLIVNAVENPSKCLNGNGTLIKVYDNPITNLITVISVGYSACSESDTNQQWDIVLWCPAGKYSTAATVRDNAVCEPCGPGE